MTEIIGEVVGEHTHDVDVYHAPPPSTLFRSDDPLEVIERATQTANVLKEVVSKQNLLVQISGRDYCRVEAWTLLGTLVGVFPVVVWSKKTEDGWEARVEARTRDGAVVGAAESECLRTEKTWKGRDDYALRSMAQTRATSKALRGPLGFVMTLAGFEATPAEEMPRDRPEGKASKMRDRIATLAGDDMPQVRDAILAYFEASLDDLDEEQLARVGTDLRMWVEGGRQGEFSVTPF